MRQHYLVLIVFILSAFSLIAQDGEYPIADGTTVTTCEGNFVDDGLESPYSGNSHTFTICPDIPGDVIQVEFIGFDLMTQPGPNNDDALTIYQGPDATFPSAGSYFGNDLSGITITGNTSNISGCLTFVFNSPTGNTAGHAGWVGLISCTTPCDAPTQVSSITDPIPPVAGLDSVSLCLGEVATFSGAGSVAAPGFVIDQYFWNFDDGSGLDSVSGISASHEFTEAGEFLVTLYVDDNNGCQSLNLTPLQVIVSTLPEVTIDFAEETCLGETIDVTTGITGVTWTSLPPQVVSGQTYLADDLGFDFESTLTFDFFEPGATLDDCADLIDIFINMEHSYLGDLEMIIECPDGTSVTLHEFGSGGGGTYLGETIDIDGQQYVGVGYDYGWSPTSTLGFLYEAANSTFMNWQGSSGGPQSGNVVNPGIYESQNDLCELVGCPLNGTWTFVVTDNLGIDDGYINEWGINFNPELFPDVTTFTPIWGQEADSSWWELNGEFIQGSSADANTITLAPTSPGTYDYTFNALNNFGCSYDTTITINVLEPLDISAGPDAAVQCDEPYTLSPFLNATPFDDCEYELLLVDTWGNGWNGGEIDVVIDGVSTTYTSVANVNTFFNFTVPHNASIEIYYTAGGVTADQDPAQNQYVLTNSNGIEIFSDGDNGLAPSEGLAFAGTVYCFPPEPTLGYSWSPPELLDNPNAQNPTITGLTETTTFTVEVWLPNHPDCVFSDEVTLSVLGALDAGDDIANCAMSYQLNGTLISNGEWSAPAGSGVTFSAPTSGSTMVTATTPGTYTLGWTDLDGLSCPVTSEIEVTFFDGITITPTLTEPTCYGDCDGEIAVNAVGGSLAPGTDYVYVFSDGTTVGSSPNEIVNLCTGFYEVELEDNFGCSGELDLFLDQPPAPVIDSIGSVRESCFGFCDGTLTIYSPVAETYSFDGGGSFGLVNENSTLCGGQYSVVIRDPGGCEASMEAFIASPTPPNAVFAADPVRTSLFEPLISFTNFSSGNMFNDWIFGVEQQAGSSQEVNPSFNFPSLPGIYTVELIITDSIGCQDSARVDIEIMDEFMVFVPTAFSPNDDGINDLFHLEITDLDLNGYLFQVFDRWGNVVYETNEYPTTWNGQGAENANYYVADGVYVWRVKAESASTTERIERMGTVTVIR